MRKLERMLTKQGYTVFNITYPSTKMSLEALTEWLHERIQHLGADMYSHVHMIGYSMGGLLTRAYIHRYNPAWLGRVVLLAPPNKGSEIADAVKNWWIYKKLYGPAGQQLITNQEQINPILGEVNYELGVIAGTRSIDPLMSCFLPKPHDGKVSVESTKLVGMKAHVTVPVSHTFFPQSRRVISLTLHFLQKGCFDIP
jgi:hypothetical protein